jgi:hypothetical protein
MGLDLEWTPRNLLSPKKRKLIRDRPAVLTLCTHNKVFLFHLALFENWLVCLPANLAKLLSHHQVLYVGVGINGTILGGGGLLLLLHCT